VQFMHHSMRCNNPIGALSKIEPLRERAVKYPAIIGSAMELKVYSAAGCPTFATSAFLWLRWDIYN